MSFYRKRKADDDQDELSVQELYRKNQSNYETAGGFFVDSDEEVDAVKESTDAPSGSFSELTSDDLCNDCQKPFGSSFLFQSFGHTVCDACRKEKDYKLITRTEAKKVYLLSDYDLDIREPKLKFISKKNPHNPRWGDMKLYLKIHICGHKFEVKKV